MRYRLFTVTVVGVERDEIEDVDGFIEVAEPRLVLEELVKRRTAADGDSGIQFAVGADNSVAVLMPHARGGGHLIGSTSGRTANFRVYAYNEASPNDYVMLDDTELNFPRIG